MSRWTLASTLLASSLIVSGCYEGPADIEGEPWEGLDEDTEDAPPDDDADDADDDGGADPSGGGDSGDPSGGGSGDDPGGDDSGDDPGGDDSGGNDSSGDDSGGDDSGGDDSGGDDSGEPPPPPSDEVPDNAYCADVADWEWTQLENEILEIVNQRRAEGANCGSAGSFGPAGPLTMEPALRCAARVHSKDMVDRAFFDHTNPSGESPFQRMNMAGYQYSTAGENIAAGNSTAAATMQQWMDSDGHCGNIMNPSFTELGVGYYPGGQYGHVWTQAFGSP